MPGVEEVRAGIALANQRASEGIAALQQATTCFEEAHQALAAATEGSGQEEVQQASGMLTESVHSLSGVQGMVKASIDASEAYAARL